MAEKKLTLEMAARTDTGRERAINEDNFLGTANYRDADWFLPAEPYTDAGSVMVVADGMGGLNAGEVASRITVDSIREFLQQYDKLPSSDDAVRNMLTKAIQYAHKKVVTHSAEYADTQGMGSTVVIGMIARRKIYFCWSGDSRGYVFRQGRLQQLTKDHSYVQSLVDEGKLTAEQASLHPESNVILQSIGDPGHAPQPDFVSLQLGDNDILLLCSDGVTGMLQDAEIQALLATQTSQTAQTTQTGALSQCAEKIVEAANHAGGIDNITVLLTKVVSGGGAAPQLAALAETTLDPFSQTTLQGKKRPAKNRLILISAILLVLTMGFLVAPMINRHPESPGKVQPVTDTTTRTGKQKKDADSSPPPRRQEKRTDPAPGNKPAHTPPQTAKPKPDTTITLTPIDPEKNKDQ